MSSVKEYENMRVCASMCVSGDVKDVKSSVDDDESRKRVQMGDGGFI